MVGFRLPHAYHRGLPTHTVRLRVYDKVTVQPFGGLKAAGMCTLRKLYALEAQRILKRASAGGQSECDWFVTVNAGSHRVVWRTAGIISVHKLEGTSGGFCRRRPSHRIPNVTSGTYEASGTRQSPPRTLLGLKPIYSGKNGDGAKKRRSRELTWRASRRSPPFLLLLGADAAVRVQRW